MDGTMRIFIVIAVLALAGCAGMETRDDDRRGAGAGAAAGLSSFTTSLGSAATAAETGGWAAGLLVLALGAFKGIGKGLGVAREKRVDEVAEGVKKANA